VSVRPEFRKFAVVLFLILVFLQVPASAYQKLFGVSLRVSTGDAVGGTLGGGNTHDLGLLCVTAICLLVGLYRETRDKRLLLLVPLLFLPPGLAEVKAFFIFTPIVCFYLLRRDLIQNPRLAFGWAIAILVFLTGSMAVYNSIYIYREKDRFRVYESRTRENLQEFLFDPQKILSNELSTTTISTRTDSTRKTVVISRLAMVVLAHNIVTENWLTTILGKGIGSFTRSSLVGDGTQSVLDQLKTLHLVSSAILELGYGGLIVVMMLLRAIYLSTRRNENNYDDPFWRGVAYGFQGVILLAALSSQYSGSFLHGSQTTFVFWFLFALLSQARTRAAQEKQGTVHAE